MMDHRPCSMSWFSIIDGTDPTLAAAWGANGQEVAASAAQRIAMNGEPLFCELLAPPICGLIGALTGYFTWTCATVALALGAFSTRAMRRWPRALREFTSLRAAASSRARLMALPCSSSKASRCAVATRMTSCFAASRSWRAVLSSPVASLPSGVAATALR